VKSLRIKVLALQFFGSQEKGEKKLFNGSAKREKSHQMKIYLFLASTHKDLLLLLFALLGRLVGGVVVIVVAAAVDGEGKEEARESQ